MRRLMLLPALCAVLVGQQPQAAPKSTKSPKVPKPKVAKVVEQVRMPAAIESILEDARAAQRKNHSALRAHEAEGKARKDFRADLSGELKALGDKFAAATDPEVKAALVVSEFWLRTKVLFEKPSEELLQRVRTEAPSTAWGWALEPGLLPAFAAKYLKEPGAAEAFLAPARQGQRDPDTRANVLFAWWRENFQEVDEVADQALALLKKDFPLHTLTRRAQTDVAFEAKTTVGRKAPDFSVKNLEEDQVTFTLASFKDKYVLVDFWATWCSFCVAEMPTLHKAYEAFKDKNLEILSLSCDRKVEDIAPFRAKGNAMPWKHAFLPGGTKHDVAYAYGVTGLPKPVLISPEGKILAVGTALRGEKLLQTLGEFIK